MLIDCNKQCKKSLIKLHSTISQDNNMFMFAFVRNCGITKPKEMEAFLRAI